MAPKRAVTLTIRPDTAELEELAYAAGVEVIETVRQDRQHPDNRSFLGRGAMEAVARRIRAGKPDAEPEDLLASGTRTGGSAEGPPIRDVELALVAAALRPHQILRLQSAFGVEVWDRTRLILEIFADRASSEEARLQVELARHEYELPLVKEAIHIQKKGERPGFMAGGEMGFVEYQNHIRSRMARIRQNLATIKKERDVRRVHRVRGGMWTVALAGYTNAGKSTMLNALTDGGATSENRLFSTLATRTRRITHGGESKLLLTDTVGFIEDLPPWLVDAFHATLEEVVLADVALLTVDASDPIDEIKRKLYASLRTIRQLRVDVEDKRPERILIVLNKIDRTPHSGEALHEVVRRVGLEGHTVTASAKTKLGLDEVVAAIRARIDDRAEAKLLVPLDGPGQTFIAWVSGEAETTKRAVGDRLEVTVGVRQGMLDEVLARARKAGAVVAEPVPVGA